MNATTETLTQRFETNLPPSKKPLNPADSPSRKDIRLYERRESRSFG
jgi:hypothetical protein